jgi:hypothetical protein
MSGAWRWLAASALVGLVLLPGCGNDRLAGSTTETENVLTGVELRLDSLLPTWVGPGDSATVAIVRLNASDLDFARTDSSGRDVVAERLDSTPLPFAIAFWDVKAAVGRLQVRIPASLYVPGESIRVRWDAPLQVRSAPAAVWQGMSAAQVLALNTALVDDFADGNLESPLPDSARWYSAASDSATVTPPSVVAAGDGLSGNALHIGYAAPSATYRYSLAGISLGTKPVNLRSLDSLVVRVRGSGGLSIAFDRLLPGDSGKAWIQTTLDTGWTLLSIRPSQLDTPDGIGGNVGWDAVCDSVTNLTFLVSGGSDLWIDTVRLYGIDRDDLK